MPTVQTTDRLFNEFRLASRGRVRDQSQVLLDGRPRLSAGFTVYHRVAPPRAFNRTIRQRSDLVAALQAAAEPGAAPRLLIVGEAGYGKTVALLDAAQHLAGNYGVPVVLSLGSWTSDDDDFTRWIVRELCAATGPLPGADDVVMRWIASGQISPVLDGLDEIADSNCRLRCIRALNTFIHYSPDHVALVVASRPDEYTAITSQGADRLAVNAAINLKKLRPKLVATRLREASAEAGVLADLVDATSAHPVVELLGVPLWLWIAGTLDQERVRQLVTTTDIDEAQRILVEAYLERAIEELDDRVALGRRACRHYVAVLAGFLADSRTPDTTTFRFENLTAPHVSRVYRRLVGVVSGLLVGLGVTWLIADLVGGLIDGLTFGLMFGLIVGQLIGLLGEARPVLTRIRWPGARQMLNVVIDYLANWMIVGVICGLVASSLSGHVASVGFGLAGGVGMGLFNGLIGGLMTTESVVAERLDDGLRSSKASLALRLTTTALVHGLVLGALIGISPGLILGLAIGLASSADCGGWYLLLQGRVRRHAKRAGLLPPRAKRFILTAIDIRLLRSTGGGVQFRHRAFLDRLAQEAPTPGLASLRYRNAPDALHG